VTVTSYTFGAHVAYLDHDARIGLVICPRPEHDVPDLDGGWTLHGSDYTATMRWLVQRGYVPLEDEDGLDLIDGCTADGRAAVPLSACQVDPDHELDIENEQRSWDGLADAAGLTERA